MARERGRDVRGTMPVLPLPASQEELGPRPLTAAEWANAQDSGKYYWAVQEGDWVEIPLDESGLPIYIPRWMLEADVARGKEGK